MNTKYKTSGRIFENPILERFTKSNPRVTIIFYLCLICFFIFLNNHYTILNLPNVIALYIFGLITWTLVEYLLHRYLFHIDDYFLSMKRIHYILHGVHHEHPGDPERFFMAPVPGTFIAFVLFVIWYSIIGQYAFSFMAGLTNGYLLYSYIHYTIHSHPANPLFYKPWSHHAKHHFKHPDKAFGVSSPIWDMIFGTMPPKNKDQH